MKVFIDEGKDGRKARSGIFIGDYSMSALSDLVYGHNNMPWPYFTDKFPVKVQRITSFDKPLGSDGLSMNDQLERDIKDAGDHLGGRTAAKCFMTRWDMHAFYQSFIFVSEKAIDIAEGCPLASKTDTEGNPVKISYCLSDTWGLIYNKGQGAKMHNHWPSLWSYTYCVFACENCAPLVFPNAQEPLSVISKTSQIIVFPAWLQHEVPTHTCEHDRIMISGNLSLSSN